MKEKWFVLSVKKKGHELKIKEWFDKLPENIKKEKGILEVAAPTQTVYKVKKNKNVRETQPKLPKYIFLKINVDGIGNSEEILDKVKNFFADCPYNSYFVMAEERGGNKNIYPLQQKEINMLLKAKENTSSASNESISFDVNEQVKIIDGAFKGFTGTITSINKKSSKVKLQITFFSRDMELELSSSIIAKI